MHQEINVQKPLLFRIFLIFFIIVELNLLAHAPIPGILMLSDSLLLLIVMSFFSYYVMQCVRYRQVNSLLLVLLPLFLIPFIAGFQAQQVFGQPFIYGFLAERTKFFVFTPLLLVYLLDAGYLDLRTLEKTLISLAKGYFFTVVFLYVLVDPALFEGTTFVNISMAKGVRYNVNQSLILILLFYSVYKASDQLKVNYLVLALTIIIYLVIFVKGRSLLFAIAIALAHIILTRLSWRQKIAFFSFSFIGTLILGLVSFVFFKNDLNNFYTLFYSAFNAVTGGEAQDGSAASRVEQASIALEGFSENPIFGNGFLSSRWNGGFEAYFRHFYPSDIGWLGVIYVYGIFGFILFNVPFFLSLRYARKIKREHKDLFLRTMESFMLYLFVHSAFAGFAIKKVGMIFFPFAIIYFYRFWVFNNKPEEEEI